MSVWRGSYSSYSSDSSNDELSLSEDTNNEINDIKLKIKKLCYEKNKTIQNKYDDMKMNYDKYYNKYTNLQKEFDDIKEKLEQKNNELQKQIDELTGYIPGNDKYLETEKNFNQMIEEYCNGSTSDPEENDSENSKNTENLEYSELEENSEYDEYEKYSYGEWQYWIKDEINGLIVYDGKIYGYYSDSTALNFPEDLVMDRNISKLINIGFQMGVDSCKKND